MIEEKINKDSIDVRSANPLSGIELPLPSNWMLTRLEGIASNDKNAIVDGPFGSNLKVSDYVDNDDGIPVLTTKNLTHGYVKENLRYISHLKFEELKRSEVKSGDILVAKIGSCGKTGIYPKNMSSAIIPANLLKMTVHANVEALYVYYFLNSPIFGKELSEIITSTAQPAFNVSKFRLLGIPLAPSLEQKRIVEAIEQQFSRLDEGVALLRQAQKKLKLYRASVLKAAVEGELTAEWRKSHPDVEPASELLKRILAERRARWEEEQIAKGKDPQKVKYIEPAEPDTSRLPALPERWCWVTVEQVSHIQGGIQKQPSRVPKHHAFPYLRVANVLRGRLDLKIVEMMELFNDELDKLRLREGDLLIVEGNGSQTEIGRCAIWKGEIEDCVHQNHIIRIRLSYALPGYVEVYWNSQEGRERVTKVAGSTSGLYTLSINKISKIPLPLPPLSEQEQIVSLVEERLSIVDELENSIEKGLKQAERQRQSILQKAFTGKLVAQDTNDEPASVLLERIRREREEEQGRRSERQVKGARGKKYAAKPVRTLRVAESEAEPLDVASLKQESLWQEEMEELDESEEIETSTPSSRNVEH